MNETDELKMNVIEIPVPDYVEYISNWKEFNYISGHLILDKTICGCGFTEYCLNNNIPTVLCSPRKKLLENKEEQHNSDKGKENGLREVYYFRNDYENNIEFDGNKNEEKVSTPFGDIKLSAIQTQENQDKLSKNEKKIYLEPLKDQLRSYINSCSTSQNNPFKIIVTYDSLHHVLDVLNEYYQSNSYAIVVDEFQSIFMDAVFKPEVELDFVEDLKNCANVLYLSATPMLEKYLVQLDYFKDLPMYKFKWSDKRVENVRVQRETVRNINKRVNDFITDYREGRYPNKILSDGTLKESKELVIFVNSIKSICDIIRKCNLKPEETNIICSDSSKNIKKLKSVGHQIGNIPTFGEPHKQFTLCTRTTYLGADFYSTNAFTIICSDCNIQTLTVDISLDLPQIIGRQRLKENVFRNEVLILYKSETKKMAIINESKLVNDEKIAAKENKTKELLEEYDKMSEKGKELWAEIAKRDSELYKNNYLGVSARTGQATFNYLVKVADQRAYDVSRKEYQDDITIKRGIESIESANITEGILSINELDKIYDYLVSEFDKDKDFVRRMKLLCDIYFQYPTFYIQYANSPLQTIIPLSYQNYINLLGFEKIRALKYQESTILEYLSPKEENKNLYEIVNLFQVSQKYSTKQIKSILADFYITNSISKTPKASDLEEYFNLKTCKVKNSDGKWENGFEIISKKEGVD
jgi:hypothetical protein